MFVAPILVFVSLALGHPMDFVFTAFEIAVVSVATLIVALIALDADDLALAPDPGYPPYTSGPLFAGSEPYYLSLEEEKGFLPDLDSIPEDVLTRANLLFLNYPNNPTGAIVGDGYFEQAVEFARANDLIVVHDDVDLPLGRLRLKRGGGAAGQKGVLSIADSLRTQEFLRVRIGVSRPVERDQMVDYVLDRFTPVERERLAAVLPRAADAVTALIRDGLESAESDDLVLKLISPLRPGLIQSGDDGGFLYLVMPIRLNV
jgi:hypothetical protein